MEDPTLVFDMSSLLAVIAHQGLPILSFVHSFFSRSKFLYSTKESKGSLLSLNQGTHFIKARELISLKDVLGEVVECRIEGEKQSKDSILLTPILKNGGIHGEWSKYLHLSPQRSELPKVLDELKIFLAEVVDSSLDFKNTCEIGDVFIHVPESITQLLCGFTIGIRFKNWKIKRVLKKSKDGLI